MVFSVRIVNADLYTAPPLPGFDSDYSNFRESKVIKVPVIRIFGSTPNGQKTCLHVHGIFPYIYLPYDGSQPAEKYLKQFATSVDFAVHVSMGKASSSTRHVHDIVIVKARPFYGYHEDEREFLKISFYNPFIVSRVVDLLQNGAIMNKVFQPHESHIPYIQQMFIDYNLYGMNLLHASSVKFRTPVRLKQGGFDNTPEQGFAHSISSTPNIPDLSPSSFSSPDAKENVFWTEDNIPSHWLHDAAVDRLSVCELEVDVKADDILNQNEIGSSIGTSPGLAAIWEEERERRKKENDTVPLTPPVSQDRGDLPLLEAESYYKERIKNIIAERDLLMQSPADQNESTETPPQLLERNPLEDMTDNEPIVDQSIVQEIVEMSQRSLSQEIESSTDMDMIRMLASLADDDEWYPSQPCTSPVLSFPAREFLSGEEAAQVEEAEQEEEESILMSQQVWDDTDPSQQVPHDAEQHEDSGSQIRASQFDLEGLEDSWEVLLFDEGQIPQLDGVNDDDQNETSAAKSSSCYRNSLRTRSNTYITRTSNRNPKTTRRLGMSAIRIPNMDNSSKGNSKTSKTARTSQMRDKRAAGPTFTLHLSETSSSEDEQSEEEHLKKSNNQVSDELENMATKNTAKDTKTLKYENSEHKKELGRTKISGNDASVSYEAVKSIVFAEYRKSRNVSEPSTLTKVKSAKKRSNSLQIGRLSTTSGGSSRLCKSSKSSLKEKNSSKEQKNILPNTKPSTGANLTMKSSERDSRYRLRHPKDGRSRGIISSRNKKIDKSIFISQEWKKSVFTNLKVVVNDVAFSEKLRDSFEAAANRLLGKSGPQNKDSTSNLPLHASTGYARTKTRKVSPFDKPAATKRLASPKKSPKKSPKTKRYGLLDVTVHTSPSKDVKAVTSETDLPIRRSILPQLVHVRHSQNNFCSVSESEDQNSSQESVVSIGTSPRGVERKSSQESVVYTGTSLRGVKRKSSQESVVYTGTSPRGVERKSLEISLHKRAKKERLSLSLRKKPALKYSILDEHPMKERTKENNEIKTECTVTAHEVERTSLNATPVREEYVKKSDVDYQESLSKSSREHIDCNLNDENSQRKTTDTIKETSGGSFSMPGNLTEEEEVTYIPSSPIEDHEMNQSQQTIHTPMLFQESDDSCDSKLLNSALFNMSFLSPRLSDSGVSASPPSPSTPTINTPANVDEHQESCRSIGTRHSLKKIPLVSKITDETEAFIDSPDSVPVSGTDQTSTLRNLDLQLKMQEHFSRYPRVGSQMSDLSEVESLSKIKYADREVDIQIPSSCSSGTVVDRTGTTVSVFEEGLPASSLRRADRAPQARDEDREEKSLCVNLRDISCQKIPGISFTTKTNYRKKEDQLSTSVNQNMIAANEESKISCLTALRQQCLLLEVTKRSLLGIIDEDEQCSLHKTTTHRSEKLCTENIGITDEHRVLNKTTTHSSEELCTEDTGRNLSQPSLLQGREKEADQEDDKQKSLSVISSGDQEDDKQKSLSVISSGDQEDDKQKSLSVISSGDQEDDKQKSLSVISSGDQEDDKQKSLSVISSGDQEDGKQKSLLVISSGANISEDHVMESRNRIGLFDENPAGQSNNAVIPVDLLVAVVPQRKPPSAAELMETLEDYGIPQCRHQQPFYSDPDDVPETTMDVGGRLLKIQSKAVKNLPEFDTRSPVVGIQDWRQLLCAGHETSFLKACQENVGSKEGFVSGIEKNPRLRLAFMKDTMIAITPCRMPPPPPSVAKWAQKRLMRKRISEEKQEKINTENNFKKDVIVQGNDVVQRNDDKPAKLEMKLNEKRDDIHVARTDSLFTQTNNCSTVQQQELTSPCSLFSPVEQKFTFDEVCIPKDRPHGRETRRTKMNERFMSQQHNLVNLKDRFGTGQNSSPKVSAKSDNEHCTSVTPSAKSRYILSLPQHSTPVAPNNKINPSQLPIFTPIVEASETSPDVHGLKPSTQVIGSQTRRQLIPSQFKFVTPDVPLRRRIEAGSELEGPSPINTGGYKVPTMNIQENKPSHEIQHLTLLSVELHVRTRKTLRPDPEFDPICAIFYHVQTDSCLVNRNQVTGIICVDKESAVHRPNTTASKSDENISKVSLRATDRSTSDSLSSGIGCQPRKKRSLLERSGITKYFIQYVEEEKDLFQAFLQLIHRWDPDILIGYELQMLSWGYLIQRALVFDIDLCKLLSRVSGSSSECNMDAEKDKWGAAHTSELKIAGRIVLNVWRLMRHEVALTTYTFENVAYHVLHERIPLFSYRSLSDWWDHKTDLHRWRTVRHYVTRCHGNIRILEQMDFIGRTSELARLFGILFYCVISRGSQFRVESMMLRISKPMKYVAVSPSPQQRNNMRAPEVIPLVMEPESRFYSDPVLVLDFQSLYPSMIIAYNYCYSTCLGRVAHLAEMGEFKFGATSLSVPFGLLKKIEDDIHVSPNGVAFVKPTIRRGVLPKMLEDILNTRIMVKNSMKMWKSNKSVHRMLDARQLGLKLIANVTFGYTSAHFSGRMPCVEIGDTIVRKARETLECAINLVNNTSKWGARVVYGDTDSMFVLLKGVTKEEAFRIGQDIVDTVTSLNPKPVKLKFEKVYLPCVLQTKKRYVGYMYETLDQKEPVFDAKGIETVRRDTCPAVAKVLEKSLRIMFETKDVSLVKRYVQRQFRKVMEGRVSLQDLTFAKEYRGMASYKPGACVPALELTRRMLKEDRRSEPRVGERVPYVVTYGTPGLPLIRLVRRPLEVLQDSNLRINAMYYVTKQLIPPLNRVFSLIGVDVKTWFSDVPRIARVRALPFDTDMAENRKKTISHYFCTTNCQVCQQVTSTGLCETCSNEPQKVVVTLNERLRNWERIYQNLSQLCYQCCESRDPRLCCISIDCPVFHKLVKSTRDLQFAKYLRKLLDGL